MPEPFATIARLRKERMSERKIAAHLGISPDVLRERVKKCPHPLPPTDAALRAEERASAMRLLTRGAHPRDVARITGLRLDRVQALYTRARERGTAPPLRAPPRDAHAAWRRQRQSGAAPPLGTLADILRRLTTQQYDALLMHHIRSDKTLADTLARMLAEALDDRPE
jgi:hypothetical protein